MQDLQGFIVVEAALSRQEVTRLNAELDRAAEQSCGGFGAGRPLSEGSPALAGDSTRMGLSGMLAWEQPHAEPFRELLCHQSTKPYFEGILGDGYRLDHGPLLLAMDQGCEGGVLHHGGADITDFSMQYALKAGRIMTGLTVCEYLPDEGPGDGGIAVVSGSHKASLPMPRSLSRYMEHTQAVTEVCSKAGDCVIFTETCSHGMLPWRAQHQRRALLYKLSPGFQSYGPAAEF